MMRWCECGDMIDTDATCPRCGRKPEQGPPRVWSERERIAYWRGQLDMILTGINNMRMHPRPQFGGHYLDSDLSKMETAAQSIQRGLGTAETVENDKDAASV